MCAGESPDDVPCTPAAWLDAKKKTLRASEQDRPDIQRARHLFRRRAQAAGAHRLIFIDEFGAHLGMARRYGRAPRGRRAHGKVPVNTDPNITLVMGLGLRGVVAPWAFEGAMNGEHFDVYVRQVLAPELKRGDVVIVDGLGAHRLHGVRRFLRARGARYWFLPGYSPDLSPVENCGSKVKEGLRAAAPRTVQAVYDAMVRGVGKVFRQDAQGWFSLKGYVRRRRHPARRRSARPRALAPLARAPPRWVY